MNDVATINTKKGKRRAAAGRVAAPFVVDENVATLTALNNARNAEINRKFNPITGEGSTLWSDRVKVEIEDFPIKVQYLPKSMMRVPMVRQIVEAGSIKQFLREIRDTDWEGELEEDCDASQSTDAEDREKVIEQFVRIRVKHDFAFWAAMYVFIKAKGGGEDVLFRLNRPQRKLVERFEKKRLAGKPIRLILLKARQWGGSTVTQIYMAWLQLVHKVGLNSLIEASDAAANSTQGSELGTRDCNLFAWLQSGDAISGNHLRLSNYSEMRIFTCHCWFV